MAAANCGPPSLPQEGYVHPYTSTVVGARINVVYLCHNELHSTEEYLCSPAGMWEPLHGNACVQIGSSNKQITF